MDRVILFGPFEFLGFGLCQTLLDKGIEVNAISISDEDDDPFTEEKRMEIGRNANFVERSLDEKLDDDIIETTPLIIPFYDFYMRKTEKDLMSRPIEAFLQRLQPSQVSVTILLPKQFEYENPPGEIEDDFRGFLKQKGFTFHELYLPTIYGPWQPKEYFFQQLLFPDRTETPTLSSRETVCDAIFIEDAVSAMVQLITEKDGKYLIKSEEQNNWFTCLENLFEMKAMEEREFIYEQIDRNSSHIEKNEKMRENIKKVIIKKTTEPSKGLELQQRQYECWLKSRT